VLAILDAVQEEYMLLVRRMRFWAPVLGSLLLALGCSSIDQQQDVPPTVAASGANLGAKVDAVPDAADTFDAEIQLAAFDEQGRPIEIESSRISLRNADDTVPVSFSTPSCKPGNKPGKDSWSVLFLMDQTGSMQSRNDPEDARIDASKALLGKLGSSNEAALWAFASGANRRIPSEVHRYFPTFTREVAPFFPVLDELKSLEGGATNFFNAAYEAATEGFGSATKANRALVAFTDCEDNSSSRTDEELIAAAKLNKVQVFTVGLMGQTNVRRLVNLAYETEGAHLQAEHAGAVISYFQNLGQMFSSAGGVRVTTLNVRFTSTYFRRNGAQIYLWVVVDRPGGKPISVPVILK